MGRLGAAGLALLLSGAAAGARESPPVAATDRYFPFRLGDSWTYEWKEQGRSGARPVLRTRTIEEIEFVGGGPAFKLTSDDGSYHVYSLREGALSLHSSSEQGRVFYYDPAVPVFAPDLERGRPRVTVHADTGRRFKTTLLDPEDVATPLGTFRGCLKVRLEMESPDHRMESLQYFAPGVGLVGYRYELVDHNPRIPEVHIEARLRLARLSGIPVASRADLDKLARAETLSLGAPDDSSARALLRRASERRYTWDDKFPGFAGDFEYREEGKTAVTGGFMVDRSLFVTVKAPTEAAREAVRSQISSFVNHRRPGRFDTEYSGARFKKGATTPEGDVEILAEGDTMGSSYLVRQDEIVRVARSAGRLRFVVDNRSRIRTEDGRYISVAYDLTYYSNEDQSQVSVETTLDSYARVGGYWLPTRRTVTRTEHGKVSSLELRMSNLRQE